MPTYAFTAPDGHEYEFDWDRPSPPSEDDLQSMYKQFQTQPQPQGESLLGRGLTVMGRVGDTLSRLTGGSAVAAGVDAYQKGQPILGAIKDAYTPTGLGTFKSNPSGHDIMDNLGMEDGWTKSAAGLAFDVLADPGNLMGGSVLKAGKLFGKSGDLSTGIAKTIDNIPVAKSLKAGVDQVFDPRYMTKGIMENKGVMAYNDVARLGDSSARAAGEAAEALAENTFKINGKSLTPDVRKAIAYAIDEGTTNTLSPELQQVAKKFTDQMDYLHQQQIALGNLKPNQKIKNYVQYLTEGTGRDVEAVVAPNVSSIPQSARTRKQFTTLKDAVAKGGATDDALEIMARSTAQVEKARTRVEFLANVTKRFENPNGRTLNFNNLNVSDTVKTMFKDKKIDPRIADDLERAIKVWEDPTVMDDVVKTATKLFKGATTSVIPSHHITNWIGNVHNMYVSGMDMKDIASNMFKSYKATMETSDALKAAAIGDVGGHSAAKIITAAKKYEIIGTSSQLSDLGQEGVQKIVNNKAFRMGRKFGQTWAEEPARLALFMDRIKKGDTLEQAAIRVKDVLFDYSELSKWEKQVRDYGAVPFYTWMRKNIPLQVKSALDHPEKVELVDNVVDALWDKNPMDSTVIPQNREDAGYIPTGYKAGGMPVMARLGLPGFDLNKIGSADMVKDSLGPIPKLVMEYASGRRTSGAPVETPNGLARSSGLANVLSPLNYVLPREYQGYITPINVDGRNVQWDTSAWLTGAVPTGPLGAAFRTNDPLAPHMDSITQENVLRLFGLSPDVITPNDQKFEVMDLKEQRKRDRMSKIVLEK